MMIQSFRCLWLLIDEVTIIEHNVINYKLSDVLDDCSLQDGTVETALLRKLLLNMLASIDQWAHVFLSMTNSTSGRRVGVVGSTNTSCQLNVNKMSVNEGIIIVVCSLAFEPIVVSCP